MLQTYSKEQVDKLVADNERLTAEGGRMRAALEKTVTLMVKMGTRSGQTIATGWVLGMAESALYSVSDTRSKALDKLAENDE